MDIISVQSRVTWGYVGNAVAVPVLQTLGINAWPVDTVRLNHHPGHGTSVRFQTDTKELTDFFSTTLDKSADPAAVLMGYLGGADQGKAVIGGILQRRGNGQDLPLYLDPAFGDDPGGTYVDPAIVKFYRDTALAHTTTLMPNRYELATLSGLDVGSIPDAITAAWALMASGAGSVMASSIPASGDALANVYVDPDHAYACVSERKPVRAKGTGDLLSATFSGLHSQGHSARDSLGHASAIVQTACTQASEGDLVELHLIDLIRKMQDGIAPLAADLLT